MHWRGSILNSRILGLKSCGTVYVDDEPYSDFPVIVGTIPDWVDVALPLVFTDPETVLISHDSMKVAEDVRACVRFVDDISGTQVMAKYLIDTIGYRSKWVANENYIAETYWRSFPAGGEYKSATEPYDKDCSAVFDKDLLYAVGGKLSIDALGSLNPVAHMDNGFSVTTDTLNTAGDTFATKLILIDRDPENEQLIDSLKTDRMRAIAYVEGARTISYGGHQPQLRYNHYWNDTGTPCENGQGTDTGIMQICRTPDWESWFATGSNLPAGYVVGTWDSLAWNWNTNIENGRYILNTYMPNRFTSQQLLFPDSCSFASCGYFPESKNKEDLKTFGYHKGDPFMRKITGNSEWREYIAVENNPPEWADYVQRVRNFYYLKIWR